MFAYALKLFILLILVQDVDSGFFSYAICQTGCNTLAVACYAAAGAIFGTVTAGVGTPASILGCNAALGLCMKACILAGCVPLP